MSVLRVILAVLGACAALALPWQLAQLSETGVPRLLPGNATPTPANALRVGVMVHPTVYYIAPDGEAVGLEYDLVRAFAITENRPLAVRVYPGPAAAHRALADGEVDLLALGTPSDGAAPDETATRTRYAESGWILLNAPDQPIPRSLADLSPKRVVVSARIFGLPRIAQLQREYPNVRFEVDERNDDETLIAAIGDDHVPYAIVEEDTFNASRHFHYDAQRAFSVQAPLARAWLFARRDGALRERADAFLGRIARDGQVARVIDRYFGFPQRVTPIDVDVFRERVFSVLPHYRRWFEEAQEAYGVEWRLLAAVAYQESHWEPDAISPTGARGIMQFTEDAAQRYDVTPLDPRSAILGGAHYVADLKRNALPARIQEPDKTWLALAAYNIGLGHVENARILTQRARKSPDSWSDVRRHLPLLTKPEIAAQFQLGSCRCNMPVEYVEAIRAYYDVLLRLEPPYQPRLRVGT